MSNIPETFALYLSQERLHAVVQNGDFRLVFLDEIEKLEKSIADSPTLVCTSTYVNIGVCLLSFKKTEKCRKHLFYALDSSDYQTASATCPPDGCQSVTPDPVTPDHISFYILLSALLEQGPNPVDSAKHFLAQCVKKKTVTHYGVRAKFDTEREKGICKHLMETYNGGFSKAYSELHSDFPESTPEPKAMPTTPPKKMPSKGETIPTPPAKT